MPTQWKILESKLVFSTPYFNVRLDRCKTLRGHTVDYYVVKRAPAAGIVAFTAKKELILVRQYRHPIKSWITEIPAGIIKEDENIEKGTMREFTEETGYEVNSVGKLHELYPAAGMLQQTFSIYIAFNAIKTDKQTPDESEDIEVVLTDLEKAVAMIHEQKIMDSDSVAGVLLAKNYIAKRGYVI